MLRHIRNPHRRLRPSYNFCEVQSCTVRPLDQETRKPLCDVQLDDSVVFCEPHPSQRPEVPQTQPGISHRDVHGSVIKYWHDLVMTAYLLAFEYRPFGT